MSRNRHYELEIAFFLIMILSGVYVAYDLLAEPAGGHPFGHWLGIIGALLMVMTETLYSVRKRTRLLNWAGPVRRWLSFHIVTGLVGPFLVLMHTGLQFRGLAGVTFGLTALIVLSGFIGRYLYTALRRQMGNRSQSRRASQLEAEQLAAELAGMQKEKPARVRAITNRLRARYNRENWWSRWRYRRRLKQELGTLEAAEAAQRQRAAAARAREEQLGRQIDHMAQTGRWFQLWHAVHIPIGLTLFAATAVHILAAFYFRAGLFR